MNFADYLKQNAQKIEKSLNQVLLDFIKETKKTNPKLLPFAKAFIKSCKGGKRIRGVLVKLGYEMTQSVILSERSESKDLKIEPRDSSLIAQNDKKDAQNDIFKIGVAFEILHTSLLIHDDIIDQSPKRRGQPSLYMALGGNHYGISQAITLGDIGLYLPIRIITETSFPDEIKIRTLNYFSQILINTGWGQVMDVVKSTSKGRESSGLSSKPTFEVSHFVNLYKTAKYTIAGPLQIGAILGGASSNFRGEQLLKKLGEFGENLGIAFQIRDDILDGEVKETDKTKASKYISKAKELILQITKDERIRVLLKDMCEYVVERRK